MGEIADDQEDIAMMMWSVHGIDPNYKDDFQIGIGEPSRRKPKKKLTDEEAQKLFDSTPAF